MKTLVLSSVLIFLFTVGCADTEFQGARPLPPPTGPQFSNYSSVIDQEAEEKSVDLLVVVDNSTSMRPDQEKLSREFSSFISAISDADYRVGVITTDTSSKNKENEPGFYGNLDVLNPDTGARFISKADPNPSELFEAAIKRDEALDCILNGNPGSDQPGAKICPSGKERPLTALRMAIEKRDSVNQGFFREGADLAVVIITDEDETGVDSTDTNFYSAQDLLDFFAAEFGESKKMVSFAIAIPEGDEACYAEQEGELSPGSNATKYGLRIGELSNLTEGFFVSICNEDYSQGMASISDYVKKNLLPLRVPVPATIVESSIYLSIRTPTGGVFESEHRIVNGFLEIHPLPPEGSKIDLRYKY